MWRDPGTWIALGVSALFVVAGVVMHQVFVRVLKQGSEEPKTSVLTDSGASTPTKQ
jgi:predicted membrane protein